jgi:hypothetical protein
MSITIVYEGKILCYIPKWPGQSKQTFINNLNCLNKETVEWSLEWSLDDKVIFITEMKNFQSQPSNKYNTPYITVSTCYGKLFIPARSKSVSDMQKAINWFSHYNPDSVFFHGDEGTMDEYLVEI